MLNLLRARKTYKVRRKDPEGDFKKSFRFTPQSVSWLSEHFLGNDEETRGGALDSRTQMKIFLRYVADPGFQIGVAEDIGVSQGTVSLTVKYVAQKITEKTAVWIKFPSTIQEIDAAKNQWLEKYQFPTAIGALDCTQVRIKKVGCQRHGGEYICRKGFASINVQATCDESEVFTSVSAEWPGSVHDSRIWRNSATCRTLRRFDNAILLADQGYGIENCVMTPFANPQTPEQLAYNNIFKRERVIIERCFGQLKQRFPILQNIVRLSLASVPTIIIACFILHNVARFLNDDAVDDVDDDQNNENDECGEAEANEDEVNNFRLLGQNKRNRLAELIYSRK